MVFEEFAPAKVNLYLHITHRRSDGYHALDSLAVFPKIGDQLSLIPNAVDVLQISGAFAQNIPKNSDNLIWQAIESMRAFYQIDQPVSLHLQKNLPVCAGIGGGSADAAAALRAWSRCFQRDIPPLLAQRLGADVPVCVHNQPSYMRGIGEALTTIDWHVQGAIVLINPLKNCPTPQVFAQMKPTDFSPPPYVPSKFSSFAELITFLAHNRNDMARAAAKICPEIQVIKADLAIQPQAMIPRLSGSGATCFALFEDLKAAQKAAATLHQRWPQAWVVAAAL